MTPIADLLEEMLLRDTPLDVILLAIRTIEKRDASRYASRYASRDERSRGAIRAARHRQKIKQNQALAEANDAAMPSTEERYASRDGVTEHCDLTSSILSKEATEKARKKEGIPRARGTRLSPDSALGADDRQFAIDHGMQNPEASWAEFVDYWIAVPGQRGTKLNWSATWRNRVRAITAKGKPHGKAIGIIEAQRKHIADRIEFGQRPSLIPGATGGGPVRLLPDGGRERPGDLHGGDHGDSG